MKKRANIPDDTVPNMVRNMGLREEPKIDTTRRNELLEKLVGGDITVKELQELRHVLLSDAENRKADNLAAALLIARIDVLLYDHGVITESLKKVKLK